MAGVLQHLRSSTLDKRPNPASMVDGQMAINYASGSPGMFFKDSNGSLVKVGPVHVGSGAPNAVPASGGTAGNSMGEQWLDTSGGTYVFKIWDGSAWRSEAGEFVNVTGDTMTGALGIIAGSAGSPSLFISGDANTGLYSPGADQLAISTNGTGRLFIDASGNVKIGSTDNSNAGSQYIAVGSVGVADGGLQLWSRTTGSSYVQFGDTTTAADQYRGYLAYLHFDDALTFGTASTERMRLDSSGRLGLGTSSPGSLLDLVGGDIRLNSVYGINKSNADGYIHLSGGTSNALGGTIFCFGQSHAGNANEIHFRNSGNQTRVVIDSSGRVGIGTTSPVYTLDCRGTFYAAVASGSNNITLGDTSNGTQSTIRTSNNNLIFSANASTESFRVDSSGRLGLGTSSPDRQLTIAGAAVAGTNVHINSTVSSAGIKFSPSSGDAYEIQAGTDSKFFLYNRTDETYRLVVDGSGNVGIGTLAPGYKLTVSSNSSATNTPTPYDNTGLVIRNDDTTAGNYSSLSFNTLSSTSADISVATIAGISTSKTHGASTGELVFYTTNNIVNERARIDSSGRLLFGTSSSTMSGGTVQQNGNLGIIANHATNVATNGTLDIVVNSGGGCYSGFLIVENTLASNAASRTQTTYAVLGRGTSATATSIATLNGSTSGASFTLTYPSNGTIRVTNTHGGATNINMAWFGPTGY